MTFIFTIYAIMFRASGQNLIGIIVALVKRNTSLNDWVEINLRHATKQPDRFWFIGHGRVSN